MDVHPVRQPILIGLILLSLLQAAGVPRSAAAEDGAGVRAPVVAGRFYPGDAIRLSGALDAYFEDAVRAAGDRPLALIAPHAGYIFSGQIAADAFNQALGHDYDLVVLLGTNHTADGFAGVSVYPGGGYRTPLGTAPIDRKLSAALIAGNDDITFEPSVHLREHSIEVLVPFVQRLFPQTPIVAAVVGAPRPDMCIRFGKALAAHLKHRRALIVASSDLSHYPAYEDAQRVDGTVLEAMTALDPQTLHAEIERQMRRLVPNLSTCACGEGPILAALASARELGATCARVVSYANSGDTAIGQRDRVVGYAAVAVTAGGDCPASLLRETESGAAAAADLTAAQQKSLLAFARKTIRQFHFSRTVPLARGMDLFQDRKQGAFVTLKKNGRLRGCIGHMRRDLPLGQVVGAMAWQAAFNDRRFSHVTLDELPQIEIEISVLTPFQPIPEPAAITVGRDGVLIKKGGRSAVFLPQVAREQGWDRTETLEHLCRKAGLPPGAWRQKAQLFTFQARVFKESDF